MIIELTEPPHCSARSKHEMAPIRMKAPRTSICLSFSLVVMSVYRLGGLLKKKNTVPRATAPKGRLIQKH